ncbi:MAG: DUF4345 domain-containing protein [Acidobacteriota bacterium]
MSPTKPLRALLIGCSSIAVGIGAAILFFPTAFHASYGTTLGSDANLLSEIRAPGGALLALGCLMLIGAFVRSFTFASTSIAAAVYLSYGLSRLLSLGLDGMPDSGLLVAAALELGLGSACVGFLLRSLLREGSTALSNARLAEAT